MSAYPDLVPGTVFFVQSRYQPTADWAVWRRDNGSCITLVHSKALGSAQRRERATPWWDLTDFNVIVLDEDMAAVVEAASAMGAESDTILKLITRE